MDDELVVFDINEATKLFDNDPATIPTPGAAQELLDCEDEPESLSESSLINGALNPVVDAVTESPDAITRSSVFDTLQFLLKSSSQIPPTTLSKILDLLESALSSHVEAVHADLEAEVQNTIPHHKKILEMYGFLLRWTIAAVETRATEKPASGSAPTASEAQATPPARGRGKGAKSKTGKNKDNWDASAQIEKALDRMSKALKLKLGRIFVTTSERDTFVSLFTKSVYHILENEARVKNAAIRNHCFRVLCIAVKHHGHAHTAQTSIMQSLTYFDHLSEPMAEFLHTLAEAYDYQQLTEEVLKEISNKDFDATDLRGPRAISTFLIKISSLSPQIVGRQMSLLGNLLDSDSYTLRCAIIEACGNLITALSDLSQDDHSEKHGIQLRVYFEVLEERFLDMNPYCRVRVMQVFIKLLDLEPKDTKRRLGIAVLAYQSLEDKSSNVRRWAVKLLGKLVSTHPYTEWDSGLLTVDLWTQRLEEIERMINALQPPEELRERVPGDETLVESLLQDVTQAENAMDRPKHPSEMTEEEVAAVMEKAQKNAEIMEQLAELQERRQVLRSARHFAEIINEATETVTQLLSSKNKSEVIEAMDFLVAMKAFKVENANLGVRRMLRLIWTNGNSDEGKGVQAHLIESYKGLFFDADPGYDASATANYIAMGMMSLTYGATPAELTSLEQLLSTMMKQGLVSALVIQKLWTVYGYQKKDISKNQRRGAIIVLGMLALASPGIVVQEMESCLRVGLGELGRRDLKLARYTCIALRRMSPPPGKQAATTTPAQVVKLPNDHAILVRLAAMTEIVSDSNEWYGAAEQAIGAIYVLSRHPDVLCSEIVRRVTKRVFAPKSQSRPTTSSGAEEASNGDTQMEDVVPEEHQEETSPSPKQNSALALAQLLFVVGHVAIKQIVHLELCEAEFKRRKAEKDKTAAPTSRKSMTPGMEPTPPLKKGRKRGPTKTPTPAPAEAVDELDLMAGTTEDDFTDAIARVREHELLFGPHSLLAKFGPLVAGLCSNNTSYNHPTLQAQAALCLAKLMCVSSDYCETHLGLLLTILERSQDPVVRSNLVVALGDMAVCFNHLIDENTDFLYRRLNDGDASVKRTCLMTLTFLILAGQVKAKGQLGEMAKCIEDSDKKIADMARMFFSELATKDNAVYNQFIDMFSLLSADTGLDGDTFKKIIKYLAGFIDKDKHTKALAGKLAQRLPKAENQKQWDEVAYTLSLFQHKDEDIQKTVAAGFKVVQTEA